MARYENPLSIPDGLEVRVAEGEVRVSGGGKTMSYRPPLEVRVDVDGDTVTVGVHGQAKRATMMAGTVRARLNNMLVGLSQGFERRLLLEGVGYRAKVEGGKLNLSLGYSHPVDLSVPEGLTVETPKQTEIVIRGYDKQVLGQFAANARAIRPLEPYKGKGVRYADERVTLKVAKKKAG